MVSEKVLKSLRYYQGAGYGKINHMLREENLDESFMRRYSHDETVQHIRNIDSAMINDGKLNGRMIYRGIPTQRIPRAAETSRIIVATAYSSCTTNFSVAKNSFTNPGGCCILAFKIPSNIGYHKFTYENIRTKTMREDEVLLERNIQFIDIAETPTRNVYSCVVKRYNHPSISKKEEKQLQDIREQFSKRQKEKTLEELVAEYMKFNGVDEEDARFMAEAELGMMGM